MPPRLATTPLRRNFVLLVRQSPRFYSTTNEPLIRVTNIPAGSTGHIRILELNRASARNAISKALLNSLREEVNDVQAQYGPEGQEVAAPTKAGPTRALVIASALDTCFCAGADLKERKTFTKQECGFPLSFRQQRLHRSTQLC